MNISPTIWEAVSKDDAMNDNDIFITYGSDAQAMTRRLLDACDISDLISSSSAKIGLKPNLVIAATPDTGATTHPEIVVAIIEYLQERGYRDIKIIESAWVGDSTKRGFQVNGYDRISARYNVPLVDVKDDDYQRCEADGISMEVSKEILDLDFLISLPVLKGHCQTAMTCALKNMKGCISDRSKRQFHSLGLHKPIAALNKVRSADLVIVDSLNGDLDFEEGGTPVQTNRMFAGTDSVLIDTFGASLMGFKTGDIRYIGMAQQMGVGSTDLEHANIVELNLAKEIAAVPTGRVRGLERHTLPSSACSACYGNLIHALARMEENGTLGRLEGKKIRIGQDYRGKTDGELGVGSCTKGCKRSLPGCPPKASDILGFLGE